MRKKPSKHNLNNNIYYGTVRLNFVSQNQMIFKSPIPHLTLVEYLNNNYCICSQRLDQCAELYNKKHGLQLVG